MVCAHEGNYSDDQELHFIPHALEVHLKTKTHEFSIDLQPSISKLPAFLFGKVLD
jgi:hypothetical protein